MRQPPKKCGKAEKNFFQLWRHRKRPKGWKDAERAKTSKNPILLFFTDPPLKNLNLFRYPLSVAFNLLVRRKSYKVFLSALRPCGIYLAENGSSGKVFYIEIATSSKFFKSQIPYICKYRNKLLSPDPSYLFIRWILETTWSYILSPTSMGIIM